MKRALLLALLFAATAADAQTGIDPNISWQLWAVPSPNIVSGVGQVVAFQYTILNMSTSATITGITVVSSSGTLQGCPVSLPPNNRGYCQVLHTVTQQDIDQQCVKDSVRIQAANVPTALAVSNIVPLTTVTRTPRSSMQAPSGVGRSPSSRLGDPANPPQSSYVPWGGGVAPWSPNFDPPYQPPGAQQQTYVPPEPPGPTPPSGSSSGPWNQLTGQSGPPAGGQR